MVDALSGVNIGNDVATADCVAFGGGGKVGRHFARLASGSHDVVSVLRDNTHAADLTSLGATPHVLSLESTSKPELTAFLSSAQPDIVVFSAGAAGKGGPERTRAVDFEGALKVFDACEAVGCRVIVVGATDVRDRRVDAEWYDDASRRRSEQIWKAIPASMQAKYDVELDLHGRTRLQYTVVRPAGLTEEPAGGCVMGLTQLTTTSRQLVAQTLLAAALEPRTVGPTFHVVDGDGTVAAELAKVVDERVDAWIG
ncbi:hypothetical protein Q5752_007027 [Cryptotrichosporon argae]